MIRELLGQPFSISTDQGSKDGRGSTTLIDPHQVCDRVIQRRGEIASEWATWLADDEVAGFHTNVIKKYLAGNLDRMWGERENEEIGAREEEKEVKEVKEVKEDVSATEKLPTEKRDDMGTGMVKQEKEEDEVEQEKTKEDVIGADEDKIEMALVDGASEVGGVSRASSMEVKEADVGLQSRATSLVSDVADAAGKVGGGTGSQDEVDRTKEDGESIDAVMASNHGKKVDGCSGKKGKKGGNLRMPKKRGKTARSQKRKGSERLA